MKKNLSLVGPIWKPYNAAGLEYSIKEALESLSNYIFKEHFMCPVIHIYVTHEDKVEFNVFDGEKEPTATNILPID